MSSEITENEELERDEGIDSDFATETEEGEGYTVMMVKARLLTDTETGKKYWQLEPGVDLKPLFSAVEAGTISNEEYWVVEDEVQGLWQHAVRFNEVELRSARRYTR